MEEFIEEDFIDKKVNEKEKEEIILKPCFVYLLLSTDNCTYIGATMDLERRLRQHNKEIKGGAYQTSAKVMKGEIWLRAAFVSGFPNWSAALQFEWRWKQLSRSKKIVGNCKNPLIRRLIALKHLLSLERSTTKAIPYADWLLKPEIHFESEEAEKFYKSLL